MHATVPISCPPWCIVPHYDQDFLEDRLHEGSHREVAGISLMRYRDPGGAPRRWSVAVELSVVRYRYHTDNEDWIYVSDGRSGLDLSSESARRLAHAIMSLLGDNKGRLNVGRHDLIYCILMSSINDRQPSQRQEVSVMMGGGE